jgi:hypothetical protein
VHGGAWIFHFNFDRQLGSDDRRQAQRDDGAAGLGGFRNGGLGATMELMSSPAKAASPILAVTLALGVIATPAMAQAPKSSLDTINTCQRATDDRERMDAAQTAQDNNQVISFARLTIEDSELCQDKLPINDRFDRTEALILETYAMETLDSFAMEDSSIANATILLANIESNIEIICTEGYSGPTLSKRAPLTLVFLDLNIVTNNNLPQDISNCHKRLWQAPP